MTSEFGSTGGSGFLDALRRAATDWEAQGLRRQRRLVQGPVGPWIELAGQGRCLSFLSNDYLGLSAEPRLCEAVAEGARRWGAGSGASALISGHLGCHAEAERCLAEFVGSEQALLFITGYMANLAVVSALLEGEQDVVFSDRLNHASLIDGCRLSRARVLRYAHADLEDLAHRLSAHPARRRLIVTDAVFSMDGDCADLRGLLGLAEQHDALLLVDDAHGFGVLGPGGRGSLAAQGVHSDRLILMGTLGKGAGLSGAFVAATSAVVEHLVQHARTYVFSTSPAPAVVAAIPTALALLEGGDWRRERLGQLREQVSLGSAAWRRPAVDSGTPILPVQVGDVGETMRLAGALAGEGVLVAGIRPPTVPPGSSRLRISLSAAHVAEDIDLLCAVAQRQGV